MTSDSIHEHSMQPFFYNQSPGSPTSPTSPHKRKDSYFDDAKSGNHVHESTDSYPSDPKEGKQPEKKAWFHEKWDNFTAPIHTRWNQAVSDNSAWPRVIYCVLGVILVGVWFVVV
jgi:hypothetical protein